MSSSSNSVPPIQGSNQTTDLWKEALSTISDEDQQLIGVQNFNKAEILGKLLAITNAKKQTCLEKRWKYRGKNGDVIIRDQLEKITAWIEKFKEVGNAIAQYDPAHVALPWAGVLFLLQITLNDSQTFGAMIEGVETVTHSITRYSIMEHLYLDPSRQSAIHSQLRENMVKLYVSILRYLARAKEHFSKATIKRLLKSTVQSADAAVHVHLSVIEKKAKGVDVCLDVLRSQCFEDTNEKASRLLRLFADVEKPILRSATQISEIHDHLRINERAGILRWLTTVPVSLHHKTIGKSFLPGSCNWLPRLPAFIDFWNSSISSVIWLHGIPGSGKTHLVYRVIDSLLLDGNQKRDPAPVAYFYCARNPAEPKRACPDEIMKSILKQLASSDPVKPLKTPVVSLYQERLKEADVDSSDPIPPTAAECVPIILELLEHNPATIVIDAIDECNPSRRHELLLALEQILQQSASLVKIFVSSRDAADISDRFAGGPNIYIRAEHNTEDIERFIYHTLENALRTRRLLHGYISDALKSEIVATLTEGAGGMFRWVSLQIENLCNAQRIKIEEDVRQEVGLLPSTLAESYNILYQRITMLAPRSRQVADIVFKWLLCAQTLLDVEKLTTIVESATQLESLSINNIFDICSFMIVVDDHNVVRFAHLSVREYLEQLPIFSPEQCHSLALESCLTACSFQYDSHSEISTQCIESLKLYAMTYWPIHCAKSQLLSDAGLRTATERFIFDHSQPSLIYRDWVSDARNLSQYSGVFNFDDGLRQKLGAVSSASSTPLFLACCFDMTWVLEYMLSYGYTDWSAENERSESGLYLAAKWKNYEVLSWLLKEWDPSPEDASEALIVAIENHDTKTSEILLQHGVDGYYTTKTEDSALHLAVRCKELKMVNRLLYQSAKFYPGPFAEVLQITYENPSDDIFAAMWARCTELDPSQYLAVFLHLMANKEDHPRGIGGRMLDYASRNQKLVDITQLYKQGVLNFLRVKPEENANFSFFVDYHRYYYYYYYEDEDDAKSDAGSDQLHLTHWFNRALRPVLFSTPIVLSECFEGRHEVLEKFLLLLIPFCQFDDPADDWTVLAVAVALNQTLICSTLLDRGADANKLSTFENVQKLELGCLDGVLSPLGIAVMQKHLEIATLLIMSGADLEVGCNGITPLIIATRGDDMDMISLIYTKGAKVNTVDLDGKTSLHHAVKSHSHQALDYLCQKPDVDINAKSNKGRTPLMLAIKSECYFCVGRLLESNADPNAIDLWGEHVLSYVRDKTSNRIVELLVTNSTKQSALSLIGQRCLLQAAVNIGAPKFVQTLLETGIDPNYVDDLGRSPLRSAVANEYEDIVQILMARGADPTLKGTHSSFSPFQIAMITRNITILQLLVSNKLFIDGQDDRGQTALHIALRENCPPEFIDVLLSAGASETCTNNLGLTPLEVTIETSHKSLEIEAVHGLGYDTNGYRSILGMQHVIGNGDDVVDLVSKDSAGHTECAALENDQSASSTSVVIPLERFANNSSSACQGWLNVLIRARRIYHGDLATVVQISRKS